MNLQALQLVPRLGYQNVTRVALHRLKMKSGWYARRLPIEARDANGLFKNSILPPPRLDEYALASLKSEANELLHGQVRLFGQGPVFVGSPPDWTRNVLSGQRVEDMVMHWSRIREFTCDTGDIKGIWEPSRFAWAVVLARAARGLKDQRYLWMLNKWVKDWIARNPVNQGPNWKCGQEASIRTLHALLAAWVLGQHRNPSNLLVQFVADHCGRIEPTLSYAMAQDNNHGTSEAAALFIAGSWLRGLADSTTSAKGKAVAGTRWCGKGRKWLEDRAARLILADGSFSQYSTNYHRMVVDTLNLVEWWRAELDLPAFSDVYRERHQAAIKWLATFTDPTSGDAPNVGPNDGSQVFMLHSRPFRDFRPSLSNRFARTWLDVSANDPSSITTTPESRVYRAGGYVKLHGANSWAMVRYPRYQFRPGDSDPLHMDLWYKGRNVLRDGGSYSYHPDADPVRDELSGPTGHNTIQFDKRDPMPRVSRFLRTRWLEADEVSDVQVCPDGATRWQGAYTDHSGVRHWRRVAVDADLWTVTDRIVGFSEMAVLRWRLEPGSWRLGRRVLEKSDVYVTLSCSVPLWRLELVNGWEARAYGELTPVPVLEAEVGSHTDEVRIDTCIRLQ